MAIETEKSDTPASQTRAARGVLRRKGAAFLRLFVRMFPNESDLLIVRSRRLDEPESTATNLAHDHVALAAYINERLCASMPRALFPNDCTRSEEDRGAIAPHILAALGTPRWPDILTGHAHAQGPVFQAVVHHACAGCPVRSCGHRRAKAHAA